MSRHAQAPDAARLSPATNRVAGVVSASVAMPRSDGRFGFASHGVDGLLIADDFFRLAHDDSGKPRLHPDVTALGLAAALLAEMILTRHARVADERIVVNHGSAVPHDRVAQTILLYLRGEHEPLKVRDWLAFLARSAYSEVAARLMDAGHVTADRRWPRATTVYVPVVMNEAAWPAARLSGQLERHEPLDRLDTILGGLIVATDLHRKVLPYAPSDGVAQLRQAVSDAPASIRNLLAHTEAAAGDAIIDGRKRRR